MHLDIRQKQLKYFQSHQNSHLNYCIEFDSKITGPNLVLTGGIHGNEPVGVETCLNLHRQLISGKLRLKKGKINFILGNPQAYLKGERFLEKNLNRVFGPENDGSLEGLRALEIQNFIESQRVDFIFDVHSVSVGNFKMFLYIEPQLQSLALQLSDLETHFVPYSHVAPGTLLHFADWLKIPSFVLESGNHNSGDSLETALKHVDFLLRHFDMTESTKFEFRLPTKISVYMPLQSIIPRKNFRFLDENVTTGTPLNKGEIFAVDDDQNHVAPKDCYIFLPDKNPKMGDSDAGFLCDLKIISPANYHN